MRYISAGFVIDGASEKEGFDCCNSPENGIDAKAPFDRNGDSTIDDEQVEASN